MNLRCKLKPLPIGHTKGLTIDREQTPQTRVLYIRNNSFHSISKLLRIIYIYTHTHTKASIHS